MLPENSPPRITTTTPDTISDLLPRTTTSVEETMDLGARLASALGAGTVLALYGALGTGKTHLVKGLAQGLGIPPNEVRSPTFTLLSVHDEGECPLYHFDAYRVQTPDEFVELGFEEYVHGDGITCIEWADRVERLLPSNTRRLSLTHVAPNQRRIARRSPDDAPARTT